MTERPIIFSSEMVRAILDGRKTQTRRVVKFLGVDSVKRVHSYRKSTVFDFVLDRPHEPGIIVDCPYGKPGDRLWVQEDWLYVRGGPIYDAAGGVMDSMDNEVIYRVDRPTRSTRWDRAGTMPRWASRIILEIVDVRVERLQDISPNDCVAEGLSHSSLGWSSEYTPTTHYSDPLMAFCALWQSIYGDDPDKYWKANPWVWVIEFKRIEREAA